MTDARGKLGYCKQHHVNFCGWTQAHEQIGTCVYWQPAERESAPQSEQSDAGVEEVAERWLSRDSAECYFSFAGYCATDREGMVAEVAALLRTYADSIRAETLEQAARECEAIARANYTGGVDTHDDYGRRCLEVAAKTIRALSPDPNWLARQIAEAREDERKACWEDVVHVVRQAVEDAPNSSSLKALHEAIFVQGWKDFGTGDGKPMHKRANSIVNEWLAPKEGK